MTTLLDRIFKTLTGIEFKEDTVTFTCMKNTLSGINYLSSSSFPLRDDDETISNISSFISLYVKDTGNVFVSIPDRWAVIQFVNLPSTKGKGKNALSQMMMFEIEKHIPYQIDDVLYDFQVVEESETSCTVVFASVFREKIDYVKEFLNKLALQPQIITLSSFAVLTSIEFSEKPLGGWQDLFGFTKKPDFWGQKGDICISLFLEKNNAYFTLLKNGFCSKFKSFVLNLNEPLENTIDTISSEMTDLLSEIPIDRVNRVILSGYTPLLPELSDALGVKLGIRVQSINPVSRYVSHRENNEIQEIIPSTGVCYSGFESGTFRINLLPHKKETDIRKIGSLTARISVPLILFLILGIFAGEVIQKKRFLIKVEKRIKDNQPEVEAIRILSADLSGFNEQKSFLSLAKEHDVALDMLSELTGIIPANAWLTNLNYKELYKKNKQPLQGELIINGYAMSSSALISILENSPFFEKVEFVGPIRKQKEKEGFKIKAITVKPATFNGISASPLNKRKQAKEL